MTDAGCLPVAHSAVSRTPETRSTNASASAVLR